jgi:hypothetical protein
MEAVARKNPRTREELDAVSELRNWQKAELGDEFVKALKPHQKSVKSPAPTTDSPYKD